MTRNPFALLVLVSLCWSVGPAAALSDERQDANAPAVPIDLFAPRFSGTTAGHGSTGGRRLVQHRTRVPFRSPRGDRRFDLGVDVLGDVNDDWRLRLRFHVRRGKPLVGWLLQW